MGGVCGGGGRGGVSEGAMAREGRDMRGWEQEGWVVRCWEEGELPAPPLLPHILPCTPICAQKNSRLHSLATPGCSSDHFTCMARNPASRHSEGSRPGSVMRRSQRLDTAGQRRQGQLTYL